MKSIEAWVTKHWYSARKTWFAYLLWPCSIVFHGVITVRRWMYKQRWLKTYRAPCPVIVIGNITVGGVGKTPFVIALYFFLKDRGWSPGIITRGYKGKYSGVTLATSEADPRNIGDEAVLLAARTDAPIAVARSRSAAIQFLVQHTACNIILSDDGLQHYAMERDLEIAIIDATKRHGNALSLPAGPLREPISRLASVDLVVVNGGKLSQPAFSLCGTELFRVHNPNIRTSVYALQGKTVHAVAAIGSPQRFFNYLHSFGLDIIEHVYPDHYAFREQDFQIFSDQDIVVMTEKDAVKCRCFAQNNHWYLPVSAELNSVFIARFERLLEKI